MDNVQKVKYCTAFNSINKDGVSLMYCKKLCGNLALTIFLVFISLCTVLVSVAVVHIGVMMSGLEEADKNRIQMILLYKFSL
jgi:hypothetical protein